MRALHLLALLLPLSSLAAVPEHSLVTLENGLSVLVVPAPTSAHVATVEVVYEVGSRDDPSGRGSLAHLTEHLMFRGSERVPDYSAEVARLGGWTNASTAPDVTRYTTVVPEGAFERVLFMEADRMAALPTGLAEVEVAIEAEVVRSEGRTRTDDAPWEVYFSQSTQRWPEGHPYRTDAERFWTGLDAATREEVVAFWERWYGPENALLVLTGDLPEDAVELARRHFGAIPARGGRRVPPALQPAAVAPPASVVYPGRSSVFTLTWLLGPGLATEPILEAFDRISLSLGPQPLDEVDEGAEQPWSWGGRLDVQHLDLATVVTASFSVAASADPALVEESLLAWWEERWTAEGIEEALGSFQEERAEWWARWGHEPNLSLDRMVSAARRGADPASIEELEQGIAGLTPTSFAAGVQEHLPLERASRHWAKGRILRDRPTLPGLEARSNVLSGAGLDHSSPAAAPAVRATPPMGTSFERWVHPSGAQVVHDRTSIGEQVLVRVYLDGAPLDEAVEERGRAWFGVQAVRSARPKVRGEVPSLVERATWEQGFSAASGDAGSWLTLRGPREDLPRLLEELALLLKKPDHARTWGARAATRRQLRNPDDHVDLYVEHRLRRELLGDHPSSTPPWGTAWTIEHLSAKGFAGFAKEWLRPSRMRVFVVGAVPRAELDDALGKLLGDREESPVTAPSPRAPVAVKETRLLLVDSSGRSQSRVSFAVQAPAVGDPLLPATAVVRELLTGHMDARLSRLLRASMGGTYGVGGAYEVADRAGWLRIDTTVDREVTAEAVRALLTELDGLRSRGGATPEELATAAALVEGWMRRQASTGWGRMALMQWLHERGWDPADPTGFLDAVRAVTPDDVSAVAQRVADIQHAVVIVVGPAEELEAPLGELGIPLTVLKP